MMQNSGLGNAVSPLTSLTWTFGLPQLLIVTWRGQPGVPDEPQHALMGPITPTMLDTMQVAWELFPTEVSQLEAALERAPGSYECHRATLRAADAEGQCRPYRVARGAPRLGCTATSNAGECAAGCGNSGTAPLAARGVDRNRGSHSEGETVLLASTGFCGRELYAIADRANHLYMVGSHGLRDAAGAGTCGGAARLEGHRAGWRWRGAHAPGCIGHRGRNGAAQLLASAAG
ncbi:MAG: hypothetical protein WDM77_18075 [Steroidobacteraceae bacterium]